MTDTKTTGNKADPRDAALEKAKEELATMAGERDAAVAQAATLTTERDAAIAERDAAKRSLTAQKGATTRAKAEVSKIEIASKPRPFGRMNGEALTPDDMLELIAGADEVAIAFSDGRSEIKGLSPVKVSGDAWRKSGSGLRLSVPKLEVHGPATGKTPYRVAGYALLIDGEQVAWAQRHEGLSIGGGQTFNLADDIVF